MSTPSMRLPPDSGPGAVSILGLFQRCLDAVQVLEQLPELVTSLLSSLDLGWVQLTVVAVSRLAHRSRVVPFLMEDAPFIGAPF